jgi:glycosyltransferase involved in cell wall biosynthesis
MKILIVLTYYVPHRTGLTLHVQRVAEALAERGHEVTVLTSRYTEELARDETINGVRIVRLWPAVRISRTQVMPAFPLAAWRLVGEHDVISLHSPLPEASLVAWIARLRGKPLVVTHHGDVIMPDGWYNRMIESLMFSSYRAAAQYATTVIAYTQDYAEHSKYLCAVPEKVRPIYPPIAIPAPDEEGVAAMREEYDLQDRTVIGYAGRFVEEKRPDLLIRTIPRLMETFPDLRIVFAGEYRIRYEDFFERCAPLVEKFRDQLVFLGLLRDEQKLADLYALFDVLALPSGSECFGLVQVEAMLCGTPVVVSDTPGAREVVRVTGMGKIFPQGDVRALAAALQEVLAGPEKYVKPTDRISGIFNLRRTVDAYEEVLEGSCRR